MRTVILVTAAALVLTPGSALAQDHGPVGITMGYPGSVGVLWHLGDRVAVRPSIAFAHTSTESGDEVPVAVPTLVGFTSLSIPTVRTSVESSGWNVGVGADVLLYLARWDTIAAYVAPGYSYRRSTTETTITFETVNIGGVGTQSFRETEEITNDGHEVRGAFGVQFTPHRRFGVFGEVGLRYSSSDVGGLVTHTRFTGTASAVGVIFYF